MAATIGFSCPLLPFSGFALAPSDTQNHQRSILYLISLRSLTPRSAAMAAVASAKSPAKEMSAVSGLDLERYMGRWYEIACFPSAFQPRDGRGTRATYSLSDGGTVRVLNETWIGGRRAAIEGSAFFAGDHIGEARLRVRFYVPPFLPVIPVVGDYWVLHVDDDCQYALVGQPSRKYLWILCKSTHLDEKVYSVLVEKAKEQGYDVEKLHKTPQLDPPPEEDEGPKDSRGFWWIKSLLGK